MSKALATLPTSPAMSAMQVADLTPDAIAITITEQLALFEKHLREAGLIKVRLGVFLVICRETFAHGDFLPFIKEKFGDGKQRTLYHWMQAAEVFCEENGVVMAKAPKVLAPILETQLDLFTDPAAKLEGMAKKFAKWASGRSIADMLRGLDHDTDHGNKRSLPPPSKKGTRSKSSPTLASHEDAVSDETEVRRLLSTASWKALDDSELHDYALFIREIAMELQTAYKARTK